jgi:uncharacterized damage-inducible protein DinB
VAESNSKVPKRTRGDREASLTPRFSLISRISLCKNLPDLAMTKDSAIGPKQQLLDALEREFARTKRVLRAYPDDKLDLKPHARAKSARELAWLLVTGPWLMSKAVTTGFDWSKPSPPPPPPATLAAILEGLEREHKQLVDVLRPTAESKLTSGTVKFLVAPKTLGDIPTIEFLWFILFDHVHHRGQFSVYLRMADGKVPSIYGPSADEPWK